MDSEKRTEYRREVERRAAALRRMRKDRGIASGKPPCAYDKIQLRDYLASLRIEDEGERCAYLAALIDYWFTGVSPDHLDGVPRAYFDANADRLSDAREDSWRKANMLRDIDLTGWLEDGNGNVPPVGEGVSHPVSDPVSDGVCTQHSYKLLPTSYDPSATSHGPISPMASSEEATGYERGSGVFETGETFFHAPCPVCHEAVKAWIDGRGLIVSSCDRHGMKTVGRPPSGLEAVRGNGRSSYVLRESGEHGEG